MSICPSCQGKQERACSYEPRIHVDGFDDDVMTEADKIARAIRFLNTAHVSNDDDCFAYGIARFILDAWLANIDPPNEAASSS